jgi:translation initiation factor 1
MKKKPPPQDLPSGPFNAAFASLRARLPAGHPALAVAEPTLPKGSPPPARSAAAEPVPEPAAPKGPHPPARSVAAEPAAARGAQTGPPPPARAVVRLERKGRGGKEATVIEKLALPPRALAEWADALKRALGCGGAVEGAAIVVQGDQRERVRRWLEARGVRKVTAG